jgi:hypothetical protein
MEAEVEHGGERFPEMVSGYGDDPVVLRWQDAG